MQIQRLQVDAILDAGEIDYASPLSIKLRQPRQILFGYRSFRFVQCLTYCRLKVRVGEGYLLAVNKVDKAQQYKDQKA